MDFTQLDYVLECIASWYRVPVQEVLDEWLEKRRVCGPDGWRLLDGIPCIIGGFTALLGTLEGRGGNFPWKTLPTVLAYRGCILGNYPENILMPGERRATLAKSKGIHNLSLHEQRILANALKDDVLTVKSVAVDARKTLMASRDPVIVGEAPLADSPHTCGRRGFANGKIDRCGSTRLRGASPPKSHATTSNPRRLRVFVEVPPVPLSWKRAIRQRSLVLELPQITTIKDGAIDEDTTEDEEEVDELVGSQQRT